MKERVTVCLCAYNHEKYIREALDRLAEQTFQDFKIIACDDGSTDHTYQILKEYESAKLVGKLKVKTHPDHKNRGIYSTYALCLKEADTEFFLGHASDDYLEKDALEYLVNLMEATPEADFAYGVCKQVDENSRYLGKQDGLIDVGQGNSASEKIYFNNLIREPSVFYKKNCKMLMKLRPTNLIYGDWFFNMLLFKSAQPLFYKKPVVNYRIHKKNISQQVNKKVEEARIMQLNKEILKHKDLFKETNIGTAAKIFLSTLEKQPTKKNLKLQKEIKEKLKLKKNLKGKIEFLSQCWQYLINRSDSPKTPLIFLNIPWVYAVLVMSKQNPRIIKEKLQNLEKGRLLQKGLIYIIFGIALIIRILLRPVEKISETQKRLKYSA